MGYLSIAFMRMEVVYSKMYDENYCVTRGVGSDSPYVEWLDTSDLVTKTGNVDGLDINIS